MASGKTLFTSLLVAAVAAACASDVNRAGSGTNAQAGGKADGGKDRCYDDYDDDADGRLYCICAGDDKDDGWYMGSNRDCGDCKDACEEQRDDEDDGGDADDGDSDGDRCYDDYDDDADGRLYCICAGDDKDDGWYMGSNRDCGDCKDACEEQRDDEDGGDENCSQITHKDECEELDCEWAAASANSGWFCFEPDDDYCTDVTNKDECEELGCWWTVDDVDVGDYCFEDDGGEDDGGEDDGGEDDGGEDCGSITHKDECMDAGCQWAAESAEVGYLCYE